jgi:hypothetical protein
MEKGVPQTDDSFKYGYIYEKGIYSRYSSFHDVTLDLSWLIAAALAH